MTIPNLEAVFDMERPLYRAVADVVAAAVAGGQLAPGTRLPAHRELAGHLGVTTGTVTRAYAELERRGLAKGEVGRGTFVRAGDRGAARFDFAAERRPGVVDLAYNLPPVGFPEEERLFSEGLAALAARGDLLRFMHYQPTQTLPDHRAAGRSWLERCGVTAPEEEIVVTAGSQHAILVVLAALTEQGDEVLTGCLTYPGVKSVAALLRLRLRGLPMDVEGVLPEALDSACAGGAKVAYLVPTIQNPTTATMSGDRRRAIVEVARRHSLTLVEDDIHGLLVPREERSEPLAQLAPERTHYIANTSKLLAPALRVSYLRAPRHAVPRVTQAIQASLWMTPPSAPSGPRRGAARAPPTHFWRPATARRSSGRPWPPMSSATSRCEPTRAAITCGWSSPAPGEPTPSPLGFSSAGWPSPRPRSSPSPRVPLPRRSASASAARRTGASWRRPSPPCEPRWKRAPKPRPQCCRTEGLGPSTDARDISLRPGSPGASSKAGGWL